LGWKRNAYRVLVGKPEGRTPHRWNENIEIDIREIGYVGMDWIHLVHDRDTVMNLRVPFE
jgi:hypothetical protein